MLKIQTFLARLPAWLALVLLSACLGNSGDSGSSGGGSTEGVVDTRVASIESVVTGNFSYADGISEILLTVYARDRQNAPLADVTARLDTTSAAALFSATDGKTDSAGKFSAKITSKTAETFTVTPIVGGVKGQPASITFSAPVGGIALSSADWVLPANATTTLQAVVYKSFLVDQTVGIDGDPLPNAPITVKTSGPGVVSEVPATTDGSGRAEFKVTANGNGTVNVTVISGQQSQTIQIYAGSSISLVPEQINAAGSATLTAVLKDGNQVPLTGHTVTFGFASPNQETLLPASAVTGADGTAQVKVTDLAGDGGSAVVIARSGQVSAQASVLFLAGIGQGRTLAAQASATVLTTAQAALITASIKDSSGVPVSGQPVSFSVNGNARLTAASGVTDSKGEAKASVSDAVAENVTVTVQAGIAKQTLLLYFGARLNLTPQRGNGVANGTTAAPLTASLLDAAGGAISGVTLNFRAAAGNALLDKYRAATDDKGQVKINVTNAEAETVTIDALADSLPAAQATIAFQAVGAGVPAKIVLTSNPPQPVLLSLNGSASLSAKVLDSQGLPVADGTRVNFSTTIGTITASAFTQGGVASAVFSAGTSAGLATVKAESSGLAAELSIQIQPNSAGVIEIKEISPAVIGILGSGVAQSSRLVFLVKDSLGNAVADGTSVEFSLGATALGGGESISTGTGAGGVTASGVTSNGEVAVTLKSGVVAGSVDVIASVGGISTVARVTIVGGQPDADRFSLAVEWFNIAGGVTFGLQDKITAIIADRFGNIVPDGTPVSFISEGGTIGSSQQSGAFTSSTQLGQATAMLQSANPTTPGLGGVAPGGNVGFNNIVAYTTGSESFRDLNGNGVFDAGIDQFTDPGYVDSNGNGAWDNGEAITNSGDMSEPFIDGNDSKIYETGELYIDVNRNGRFDGPDGAYQANTTVWESMTVLFSGYAATPSLSPRSFAIGAGGREFFTIGNLLDQHGNPLVAGTQISVSATGGGTLGGTTSFTLRDSRFPHPDIVFSLASSPTGTKEQAASVNVRVTSPANTGSPGSNQLDMVLTAEGTVLVEASN